MLKLLTNHFTNDSSSSTDFIFTSKFIFKTVNEKIQVVSEVLMNILSNFVPHKSLKFDYKQPPWMNPEISSHRKCAKL